MDPADISTVRSALSAQGKKILYHETQLNTITLEVKQLMDHQAELQTAVANRGDQLATQLQLVITCLEDLASPKSATPVSDQPSTPPALPPASPHPVRLALLEKYSGDSTLLSLKQRNRRVDDYAIESHTLAADSGWNKAAINDACVSGLVEEIKDHLAPHEIPADFKSRVDLATRIDTRLQERERERCRLSQRSSEVQGASWFPHEFRRTIRSPTASSETGVPSTATEEPMQLGRTKLAPDERQQRMKGACFYCGQPGHRVNACPIKGEAHQGYGRP
ncbi:hypothetical protein L3Q82_008957 [Scortum barcoo]|uniref:Uncharacterized protein n=1 Tax=Scortum barcoo TaxID=214431 RepID=A0ACB8XCT9_9TELE|nr:hypothetical protein L3Q82_008957 [Scortum barcoo]